MNEKYILGIEDTNVGYKSLKNITNLIYLYNSQNNNFKNNNCFIFDNYNQLLKIN